MFSSPLGQFSFRPYAIKSYFHANWIPKLKLVVLTNEFYMPYLSTTLNIMRETNQLARRATAVLLTHVCSIEVSLTLKLKLCTSFDSISIWIN